MKPPILIHFGGAFGIYHKETVSCGGRLPLWDTSGEDMELNASDSTHAIGAAQELPYYFRARADSGMVDGARTDIGKLRRQAHPVARFGAGGNHWR